MGAGLRGRLARAALAVLALGASGASAVHAAPLPSFAGTTVITARGNGGVALSLPRNSLLDLRGREPHQHAVTIARRGGTYAFVGLSEPEACKRYNDPNTTMCMAVHGYDMAALRKPGMPSWAGQQVVTLDPAMVGKGRIEVYVLTDGEVTLTVRFKGLTGTRRVRADRKVTGWMRELPKNCAAACGNVAFGGAAYDVGKGGFVAGMATVLRDTTAGTSTPVGHVTPGTQAGEVCIYGGTAAWEASPEPADHPTGCDPVGNDPLVTATNVLNAPSTSHPGNDAAGGSEYEYGARGRVYVGYNGAVAGPGAWQSVVAYGVWVSDGLR